MQKQSVKRITEWFGLFAFIVFALLAITAGFAIFSKLKANYTLKVKTELETIANYKVSQVTEWRQSCLEDASTIFHQQTVALLADSYFKHSNNSSARIKLMRQIHQLYTNKNITSLRLYSPKGTLLIPSSPGRRVPLTPELVKRTVKQRQIYFSEVMLDSNLQALMSIFIPLIKEKTVDSRVVGVVQLIIDPNKIFFPMLQTWPIASPTAEVELVTIDNDDVLFINELKHIHNTAGNFRLPLTTPNLVASQAVQGYEGFLQGNDHRGEAVFAYILPVPDTDWRLIVKIDRYEFFRPLNKDLNAILLIVGLIIFIGGLAISYYNEVKRHQIEIRENLLFQEQQVLSLRYDSLSKYANDVIFLLNDNFEVIDVNDRVWDVYGYTREDLKNKCVTMLRAAGTPVTVEDLISQFNEKDGIIYETYHLRKDGTSFPVDISLRRINYNDKFYYQGIVRDISDRKKGEALLLESEAKFRDLAEQSVVGIYYLQDDKFIYVNPKMAEMFGYTPEEMTSGLSVESIILEEDKAERLNFLRKLYDGEIKSYHYTFQVRKKDHTIFDAEAFGSLTVYHGKPAVIGTVIDITDRKGTERALQASEDRYRAVVENSQNGIIMVGSDYRINFTNQTMLIILNRSEEEIVGHDFREFLDEESTDLVADHYIRRRRGEEVPSRYEFNVVLKDGGKRRVEISSTIVKDMQGEVFTVAQFVDITERKQAEEALAQSEEKFRSIVENALVGIYILDDSYRYMYVNDELCKILGYQKEELIDHDFRKVLAPDSLEFVADRYKRRQAGEEVPQRYELNIIRPNGEIRNLEMSATSIKNKAGKSRTVGQVSDITERKQAEEKLRESEEKYRALFNQSAEGIYLHDLDGRIIDVNKAACEQSGYTSDELLRLNIFDLHATVNNVINSPSEEVLRLWHQWRPGESHDLEAIHKHKDGSTYPVRILTGKISYGSNDLILALTQDITEQKQQEEIIRASEEHYRYLFEHNPGIMMIYEHETLRILAVNEAFEKHYGYTNEEAVNLYLTDIGGDDSENLKLKKMVPRLRGLQHVGEWKHRKKDGTIITIMASSHDLDYQGKKARVVTVTDITARKQIEDALQESEERYRYLFEHNPGIMLIYDRSTLKILAVNEAFSNQYGYSKEDILNKSMPELFATEEEQRRITELVPHLHGYQNIGEWHNRTKNGSVITIVARSHDINYKGIEARVAIITDITARKLAEEALRESENRYRALFETMTQGVIYQDKDGRIISANPATEQILGLSFNELKNLPNTIKDWKAIYEDGSDYPFKEHPATIALRTGHPVRNQLMGLIKPNDQKVIWLEMDCIPQFHPGDLFPSSIFTIFSDITAKKEAEQAVIKKEQETRQLIDNMIEGLLLFDIIYDESGQAVDYRVIDANPSSESITGLTRAEIIGKKASEVMPGIRPPYLDLLASIAVTGQAQLIEADFKETGRWYRVSAFSPVKGRCAIVYEDITEQKQWEITLRESEERLRLTLNAAKQGLFDINMHTQDIIVTPEYARMLGYDPVDFHETQTTFWERIHPDDREYISNFFYAIFSESKPEFRLEYRQKTAQGNFIWVRSIGSVIEFDEQGKPLRLLGVNIDITESRAAEDALRESEERLRLALNASNQGMFDFNLKTGKVIITPDFTRMMGYDPDHIHEDYDSWLERMHPEDRKPVIDAIKQLQTLKKPDFRAEYRQRKADGSYAWILSIGKVVEFDEQGRPLRLLGTDIDITARKAADAALQESEERFRSMYENATIGHYRTTPEGKILMANPACVRMMGFDSFEELATRNLEEWGFVSSTQRRQFRELMEKNNIITGLESTWLRKDGTPFYVLESARTVRDEHGKVIYYDGTFEDITERKKAEMALQETHAQYRQALTQAKAVPYLRYYHQSNYAFIGEEIIKYTGYSSGEFVPKLWLTLRQEAIMLGDSKGMNIKTAGEAFRSGKINHWLADYRIKTRNGETRWLNDSAVPITDQNGKVVGALGVLQDITERKHAEEVIQNINRELEKRVAERTAQLQAANKELEAFSYSVSHDLRAPLRAIDGFTKIILEDYKDKFDNEGQRLFNVIRDNAQKMGQLISDLLEFSRTGRKEVNIGPVDLNRLFKEIFTEMNRMQPERNIKLTLKRLPEVSGDANLLKIVITNLLSNAIKYTRQTPIARINVGYKKEPDRHIISVQDNGVGFDMRYVDKLFGVFQRLHTEQEFEGTGVGLALIQRIIHKHGGEVWAEGEVGKGATFYFSLPLVSPAIPEGQA